jgi:ribulose-5-phosphate 4-epimerase/fuculose-1-phosphate aldolase
MVLNSNSYNSFEEDFKSDLINLEVEKIKAAKTCRLLYKRGMAIHGEGNVSFRFGSERLFIKKTGKSFRSIRPEDFVLTDFEGHAVKPDQICLSDSEEYFVDKPSSEKYLHINIYKAIPEMRYVIHTHPLNTIAYSKIGKNELEIPVESNAYPITGNIPIIGPLPAGSEKLANGVVDVMLSSKKPKTAVIMKEHGLVVASHSLEEAFDISIFIEKIATLTKG